MGKRVLRLSGPGSKGSKGSEGSEGKVSPGGDEFYSQRYGIGFCVSSIAKQRVKDKVVD